MTRIENWAGQGIPDLLICDDQGRFHFVELKFSKTNAVKLSPHQVAWLTKHRQASVWVLVKYQPKPDATPALYLYRGSDAMAVKLEGLKHPPELHLRGKFDWVAVFDLISPR